MVVKNKMTPYFYIYGYTINNEHIKSNFYVTSLFNIVCYKEQTQYYKTLYKNNKYAMLRFQIFVKGCEAKLFFLYLQ